MVTYIKEDSNFNQGVRSLNQKRQDVHNSAMPEKKGPLVLTSVRLKDAGVKVRIPFIKEIKDHLNKLQAARQWWVLSDCDTSKSGFEQHPYGQSYVYGNKVFDASKKKREKNLKYSLGIRPALTFNKIEGLNSGDEFRLGTYTFLMVSDTVAVCESLVGYSPYEDNIKSKNIPSKFDECSMKEKIVEWWDVVANKTKGANDNSMSAEQDIKGDNNEEANGEQNEQEQEEEQNEEKQENEIKLDKNNLPVNIDKYDSGVIWGVPNGQFQSSFNDAKVSIPLWGMIKDHMEQLKVDQPWWVATDGFYGEDKNQLGVIQNGEVWLPSNGEQVRDRMKEDSIHIIKKRKHLYQKEYGFRPVIYFDEELFANYVNQDDAIIYIATNKTKDKPENARTYPFRVLDSRTLIYDGVLVNCKFANINSTINQFDQHWRNYTFDPNDNKNQQEEKTESVSRDFWNMLIESKQYK